MRYHTTTGDKAVMLQPETIEECGLFQWLSTRFSGQRVRIVFDTTMLNGNPNMPMVWIKPAEPEGDEWKP